MNMISELKDEEILDFLMTSEFESDYKPEEFRYLLFKWRYFYRVLYGKYESNKVDLEGDLKLTKDELQSRINEINTLRVEIVKKDEIINSNLNRKLNWKERISGKINIKNENQKV